MSETSAGSAAVRGRTQRAIDWFKSREQLLIAIGIAVQFVILAGMIALRAIPHLTGTTVLLQVVPLDPRDLFRGDYVILGYEFSRLSPSQVAGLPTVYDPRETPQERTIYVSLVPEPDGLHHRMGAVGLAPPAEGKFLRGTWTGRGFPQFGIERYYVQEGAGKKYEEAILSRRLWAQVAVAPDGTAALEGLHIESEPTEPSIPPRLEIPRGDAPAAGPVSREFDQLAIAETVDCQHSVQTMDAWGKENWSEGRQLFCRGDVGARIGFTTVVERAGRVRFSVYATRAPDYGIVQATLDDIPLSEPIDLYGPSVLPPIEFVLGERDVQPGPHTLSFRIVGKNELSGGTWLGLDRLVQQHVSP